MANHWLHLTAGAVRLLTGIGFSHVLVVLSSFVQVHPAASEPGRSTRKMREVFTPFTPLDVLRPAPMFVGVHL